MTTAPLHGKKILITGATGQVARPVAEALASDNEVWCIGRFSDPGVRQELASQGLRTWYWDMGRDDLTGLPGDFSYVLHAAMHRGDGSDFEESVEINSVATGRLMAHCRRADAFLYVSTGAIYAPPASDRMVAETDPLGGQLPWLPTYPIAKIAAEGAVRAGAATFGLPTVIARLNVAYGPYGHGGVPMIFLRRVLAGDPIEVPMEGRDWCSPIHTDDIARQVPLLWGVATAPARVVNWGGDEAVGMQDLVTYLSELAAVTPTFVPSDVTRATCAFDNSRRRALIGDCAIHWQEGLRRVLEEHGPALEGLTRP